LIPFTVKREDWQRQMTQMKVFSDMGPDERESLGMDNDIYTYTLIYKWTVWMKMSEPTNYWSRKLLWDLDK
jgi:hypothetical protein